MNERGRSEKRKPGSGERRARRRGGEASALYDEVRGAFEGQDERRGVVECLAELGRECGPERGGTKTVEIEAGDGGGGGRKTGSHVGRDQGRPGIRATAGRENDRSGREHGEMRGNQKKTRHLPVSSQRAKGHARRPLASGGADSVRRRTSKGACLCQAGTKRAIVETDLIAGLSIYEKERNTAIPGQREVCREAGPGVYLVLLLTHVRQRIQPIIRRSISPFFDKVDRDSAPPNRTHRGGSGSSGSGGAARHRAGRIRSDQR